MLCPFCSRPTISNPVTPGKEESGRPYEEIEFEDKKVNGSPKINGEVTGTSIPHGTCLHFFKFGVGRPKLHLGNDPTLLQKGAS